MLEQKEQQQREAEAEKHRLIVLEQNQSKSFANGLFLPGIDPNVMAETDMTNFEGEKWKHFGKVARESSLKQTLIKEYSEVDAKVREYKRVASSKNSSHHSPKHGQPDMKSPTTKLQGQNKTLQHRRSKSGSIVIQSLSHQKSKLEELNPKRVSIRVNKTDNKLQSDDEDDPRRSVFFLNDRVKRSGEDEALNTPAKKKDSKQLSIAHQLKTLLYKADIREMMPDKYLFNKHRPHKQNSSKQSMWIHDRHSTKASDVSTGFQVDVNWIMDRMMADRPENDPERVLSNNNTMNIKNQQIMIEVKTGDHPAPPAPKKKTPAAYEHKSFLIKCSYELGKLKEGNVPQGVRFGIH